MGSSGKWTYDEIVLALYAYCHVPFNRASDKHPWIVKIASIINRTPAAVKMKIGNLGKFDPDLRRQGIVGLSGASKLDEIVWNHYYGKWNTLVEDAEKLISKIESRDIDINLPVGTEEYYTARRRVNQAFFRDSVLTSYNGRCCISHVKDPRLLEACHIKNWADNEELRTDPSNGLCLNVLLHKAYDNFLISISPDYIISISDAFLDGLNDDIQRAYYLGKDGQQIVKPTRFFPYRECLEMHYNKYRNTI